MWEAKKLVLDEVGDQLHDPLNYGFYLPPVNNRAGKFLDEERPLDDYKLSGMKYRSSGNTSLIIQTLTSQKTVSSLINKLVLGCANDVSTDSYCSCYVAYHKHSF